MTILRRHGNHVAALDFVHADKRTFKFVRKFCPLVYSLSLVFDDRSSWVSYRHLEKFFHRMPQITALDIRFDACYFSPAMFWCLSQLPKLTNLTMDVYYEQVYGTKHYSPDTFMTILDCCLNLHELTVCGQFLEPADSVAFHRRNSFQRWVKKTLRPQRENAPTNIQDAITPHFGLVNPSRRSRSWSVSAASITRFCCKSKEMSGSAHQKSRSDSFMEPRSPPPILSMETPSFQRRNYIIRKLNLRSPHMDDDVFCVLATRCPLLEELVLDGVWIRISNDSWGEISAQCPRLRSLSVRNSGAVHFVPTIQTLMTMFPRLESLSLMALEFSRDPDLSDLATKLQEMETTNGVKHPLKQIHLSGSILRPLKVLLDIVTQNPTAEALSVGFTLSTSRQHDHNDQSELYDLNRRWLCQDTLTHLDLTSISFPDKKIFSGFFGHVQRLSRLKSLWISISHIREAMRITAWNRGGSSLSRHGQYAIQGSNSVACSLTSSSTPDLSTPNGSRGNGNNHNSSNRPLTSFYCFPALETLRIGMACYLNKKWFEMPVMYDEVEYMIDVTPILRRLELKHMSESGVIKQLALSYPRIEFS